jgi:hypothetical protein
LALSKEILKRIDFGNSAKMKNQRLIKKSLIDQIDDKLKVIGLAISKEKIDIGKIAT